VTRKNVKKKRDVGMPKGKGFIPMKMGGIPKGRWGVPRAGGRGEGRRRSKTYRRFSHYWERGEGNGWGWDREGRGRLTGITMTRGSLGTIRSRNGDGTLGEEPDRGIDVRY